MRVGVVWWVAVFRLRSELTPRAPPPAAAFEHHLRATPPPRTKFPTPAPEHQRATPAPFDAAAPPIGAPVDKLASASYAGNPGNPSILCVVTAAAAAASISKLHPPSSRSIHGSAVVSSAQPASHPRPCRTGLASLTTPPPVTNARKFRCRPPRAPPPPRTAASVAIACPSTPCLCRCLSSGRAGGQHAHTLAPPEQPQHQPRQTTARRGGASRSTAPTIPTTPMM